ncbi:MAG: hydrogenase, partial [Campylobacterota bacterium]|nr:hydrogenase [Campylobacterota bacterium]
ANPAQTSYEDHTIFSPHYSQGSTLLLTNASRANELFILTPDELKALFSIEKPTLKVTIADPTLQEMSGKKFISIKAPYNNKSLLASINAKESEIDYLFFHSDAQLEAIVVQKNISLIHNPYEKLERLHDDAIINRFGNIQKEAEFQSAIGCYLSTKGISFVVANEMATKRVIEFGEFSMDSVLETFKSNEKRSKLLENFKEQYPQLLEPIIENEGGLFETISAILELDQKSFESLNDKSYEFRGNGGLKIDTHFSEDGDFDYADFIGSIMSFKLAGVDTHYLAYSIFEALADMAISVCNQLKTKFKIEHFIMMGNLFGNSILYSRVLSKFQLANPYFSPSIALDDC